MNLEKNRNLYTSDVLTLFLDFDARGEEKMSARHLHQFVAKLAQSGVDTFLVNPNFQRAWYPSKHVPSILEGYERGDREYFRGHWYHPNDDYSRESEDYLDACVQFYNQFLDLIEEGTDWLAETAAACRTFGISPWLSIRMNDTHSIREPNSPFNHPIFQDDRFLLKNVSLAGEVAPRWDRGRSGLNYEHPEVRDYMFAHIEDAFMNYDYDGIEMDWLRGPLCCERPASREATETMTAWVEQVRGLTVKKGRASGKTYVLGMRMPANIAAVKNIGLDVEAMVKWRLLDYIAPSNFLQAAWDVPYDRLRAEFGRDIAIYGTVEGIVNYLPVYSPSLGEGRYERLTSMTPEALCGNAAGKLAMGADGIQVYNFFVPEEIKTPGYHSQYSALQHVHNLDELRGKPKQYTFSTNFRMYTAPPYEMTEQVPVILERGWRRGFRLSMCAEPAEAALQLVIQVIVRKQPSVLPLGVSFNGAALTFHGEETDRLLFPSGPNTLHSREHTAYNYMFPASLIRDGWNEVTVYAGKDPGAAAEPASVYIACIELAVCERGSDGFDDITV